MAINLELASRIKELSTPREPTREAVVEYYQEKYPHNWKAKLAQQHQGFTTAKGGGLMSIKNIERRFQSRKGRSWEDTKPSAKQQEEYAAHAEYLPPKPPSGIIIDGDICVRYADNPCETRHINIVLEGDEMKYLLENYDMQTIVNAYMPGPIDDDDPTIAECPCGGPDCECDFSITAIEE